MPEDGAPKTQSQYGTLSGTMTPKIPKGIAGLSTNGTPMKILGALAVLLLTSRMFMSQQREHEHELQDLRARLEGLQQAKGAGYRKLTDTTCGGLPVDSTDLSAEQGCKSIRATSREVELSRKA